MTPEMKKISGLLRQMGAAKALNPNGMETLLGMIDAEVTKIGMKKFEKDGWSENEIYKMIYGQCGRI